MRYGRAARYAVEAMCAQDRRLHAAFKIRRQLGQRSGGLSLPFPPKPHRMRWHSHFRLANRDQELESAYWAVEVSKLYQNKYVQNYAILTV
ncbi:MAG: hypothetical protein ABJZ84_00245 [Paracoccaceae bacterium]